MKECIPRNVSYLIEDRFFFKKYEIKEVRQHEFESSLDIDRSFSNPSYFKYRLLTDKPLFIYCKHCGAKIV